jgi:CHAT domain-containing protein
MRSISRNPGLVTLSACESGLGKVSSGDEIWGFTRSFLSAGARALLVSLWPVADESTELLMTRFYQNSEQRKGSAGLAAPSRKLDLARNPKFAHPFFWAHSIS